MTSKGSAIARATRIGLILIASAATEAGVPSAFSVRWPRTKSL